MPPMRTCGIRWNVGSDDFVLPALFAVLIRLVSVSFIVGVLIYLYFDDCPEMAKTSVPPILYGSLFALIFILTLAMINETIIFSISIKGGIMDTKKRKMLPCWLFLRIGTFILESITVIFCTFVVFSPTTGASTCHDGPLVFAKVTVVILLVILSVYSIGFAIYLDPLGFCCTTSVMHDLGHIHDVDVEEANEGDIMYAKKSRLGKLHRSHIGYSKVLRKLRNSLCCLDSNGNRSRRTAMREMALAFHTLFTNDDRVVTDLVAGLFLLSRYQKKARNQKPCCQEQGVRCPCFYGDLKEVTFKHMPADHIPNSYLREEGKEFNPAIPEEKLLIGELEHYMNYAMGIYGWPLHVFDKPCCGVCQICSVTCLACNFRCCHPMAHPTVEDDFPRVVNDNCCMSGLGTIRLRSQIPESQVLYVSYENEVFKAPFSICCDRSRKAIVLTVRGTLSIKDALTDLSISMKEVEEEYQNPEVDGKQFMHIGIYTTAKLIYKEIETKNLLEREFSKKEFRDYHLVLTGHSLGAGVASVLSVILKPYYPDLECYVFSPPGCIFSLPLAVYSRDFITAVVLGNDMIPRVTFRSLLFLKRKINYLINKSHRSKFQIIFRPQFMDHLPRKILQCLCKNNEDPDMSVDEILEELNSESKYPQGEAIIQSKKKNHQKLSLADVAQQIIENKRSARKRSLFVKEFSQSLTKDSLHSFVKGVEEGELIAAFPPGRILHIGVRYSKRPWLFHYCYPDTLSLRYLSGEDLCVIAVDRGMVDDHLPNNVLAALKRCQREIVGSIDDPEVLALRQERIKKKIEMIAQRRPPPKVCGMDSKHFSDQSVHIEQPGACDMLTNGTSSSTQNDIIVMPEIHNGVRVDDIAVDVSAV